MRKVYNIWDCVRDEQVDQIVAGTEKSALKQFLKNHMMSTGIYEFTQEETLHLRSSYGSDFVAVPERRKYAS